MSRQISLKPIISEKSLAQVENLNGYTFQVPKGVTKGQIKEAVERVFGVKVLSVHTKTVQPKAKRAGRLRRLVHGKETKKALVKLEKKDKIDLFEVKEGEKKK